MISCVDRGDELALIEEDFERARKWLFEVESVMSQVFKAGYTTGDRGVMDELISQLKQTEPLPWNVLRRRASYLIESYKLDKVLDIMVQTGEIKNVGGNRWTAS